MTANYKIVMNVLNKLPEVIIDQKITIEGYSYYCKRDSESIQFMKPFDLKKTSSTITLLGLIYLNKMI